jgi:DNA modification methylase
MEKNRIYIGNNLDVLKQFPDNYFDSVVTDPPYGLSKEPDVVEVMKSWIEKGHHKIGGKGFMGKEWDSFVPQPILWKEVFRVLKSGGYLLSFAGTRTYDWVVIGLRFAGFEIRDMIGWLYGSGFPKGYDVSKGIDKKFGAEREVVGKHETDMGGLGGQRLGQKGDDITAPSTDQAKQWQGWGTTLKPAIEPIVMARKPLDGTVAENVLKWGVGGINIDECRIEFVSEEDKGNPLRFQTNNGSGSHGIFNTNKDITSVVGEKDRWPANIIHDGSDEVKEIFPDDSHRFFYEAKASQSERNEGLYGFEEKYTAAAEFRPNHMEKALEGESGNPFGRWQPKKNIHPTVKPIKLMRYLVKLVTPKGGCVLDPYLGSGTTAIACKKEKFDYVGIELEQDYADIAEARIKATVVEFDIFDFIEEE